jgi:hypothetical protein
MIPNPTTNRSAETRLLARTGAGVVVTGESCQQASDPVVGGGNVETIFETGGPTG